MAAYYNEFDPKAAAWLRELIKRGLIADGEVDDRSIVDVRGDDLRGFTQCHFFAGIGGWSYALRLAGWPDDRPVWTGSPPCQPFSAAGQRIGKDDERHLTPHFANLVADIRPTVIVGEQVASAAVLGTAAKRAGGTPHGEAEWAWIDDLFGRLEAAHYACGAVDLPAACVGAPHIRQRTFFGAVRLADASGQHVWRGLGQGNGTSGEAEGEARQRQRGGDDHRLGGADERLADAADAGSQGWIGMPERAAECVVGQGGMAGRPGDDHRPGGPDVRMAQPHGGQRNGVAGGEGRQHDGPQAGWQQGDGEPERGGAGGGLADADREVASRRRVQRPGQSDGEGYGASRERPAGLRADGGTGPTNGYWRDADWLFCRDGKWRPVEPSVQRVVDGVSVGLVRGSGIVPASFPLAEKQERRVMRLRGYGNAIVPQVAAEFIRAMMEVIG